MIREHITRICRTVCQSIALAGCLLCLAGCTQLATSARSAAQTVQKQVIPDSLTAGAKKLVDDPFSPHKPHPAVVRIMAVEANGVSFGSGTLIHRQKNMGLVITNWHVVRDSPSEIIVTFPNGFRTSARVTKADAEWDLAALLVWSPEIEPVEITETAPRPGDLLTIAGYGSGVYRAVSGTCAQYVAPSLNKPHEMVELNAVARQGDSGGPILNDKGELAGVLFGASWRTTSGSYSGRVKSFIEPVISKMQNTSPKTAQANPMAVPTAPPVEPKSDPETEMIADATSQPPSIPAAPQLGGDDSQKPSTVPKAPSVAATVDTQEDPTLTETEIASSATDSQPDSVDSLPSNELLNDKAGANSAESESPEEDALADSAPIQQLERIEIPKTETTEYVPEQPVAESKSIPPFELDENHLWEKVQLAQIDAVGLPEDIASDLASEPSDDAQIERVEELSDPLTDEVDQTNSAVNLEEESDTVQAENYSSDYNQVSLTALVGDSPLSNLKMFLYTFGFLAIVIQLARRRE